MSLEFVRKLPTPTEIREQYPLSARATEIKKQRDAEIAKVFTGDSDKFLVIVGPCSADNEDAVLEYNHRLAKVADKVSDKLIIIPRVYTNKPRTTGEGYKGIVHQPDPEGKPDLLHGLIAMRKMHMRVVEETDLTSADEMLYPSNWSYLSDILSYVAVGARSVENQEHRLTVSGIDIPAGMKNPTSGDLSVMINSVTNYHYEDIQLLLEKYNETHLVNPATIIDANHSNSGKKYEQQIRIVKDVLHTRRCNKDIESLVKGVMIESYLEPGNQKIGCGNHVYGKSITDPCLGWDQTERLIYDIAEEC